MHNEYEQYKKTEPEKALILVCVKYIARGCSRSFCSKVLNKSVEEVDALIDKHEDFFNEKLEIETTAIQQARVHNLTKRDNILSNSMDIVNRRLQSAEATLYDAEKGMNILRTFDILENQTNENSSVIILDTLTLDAIRNVKTVDLDASKWSDNRSPSEVLDTIKKTAETEKITSEKLGIPDAKLSEDTSKRGGETEINPVHGEKS